MSKRVKYCLNQWKIQNYTLIWEFVSNQWNLTVRYSHCKKWLKGNSSYKPKHHLECQMKLSGGSRTLGTPALARDASNSSSAWPQPCMSTYWADYVTSEHMFGFPRTESWALPSALLPLPSFFPSPFSYWRVLHDLNCLFYSRRVWVKGAAGLIIITSREK